MFRRSLHQIGSHAQPELDARSCPGPATARWLAAAFALYGLLATAFLAINMPPFQNPDEPAHFLRAAQVADGRLIGTRYSVTRADGSSQTTAGGPVDPAVLTAAAPFVAMMSHPNARATRANWEPRVDWSGTRSMASFPNTAIYPPLFYAPAAVGVLVGQAARMSVVQTLMVSRLLTGVAAVAIGVVAIACAGGAAAWIFAVLTLPMTLSLIASSSQDALLLACSALAGALLMRILRGPGGRNGPALAALVVTLALVATARPTYGALAVMPLALAKVRLRWRILAAAVIVACVASWSSIAAALALADTGEVAGANPAAQMAHIRDAPLLMADVVRQTLAHNWRNYVVEFVGQLGWLDTALPQAYHAAARVMLAVAAMATMLRSGPMRTSVGSRLTIAAGLLLAATGLFAAAYLTWSLPGNAVVEGVQGRYLLPLALAGGAALLPALGSPRLAPVHCALTAAVAAFPVVTLAVVMRTVVLRYYLG